MMNGFFKISVQQAQHAALGICREAGETGIGVGVGAMVAHALISEFRSRSSRPG